MILIVRSVFIDEKFSSHLSLSLSLSRFPSFSIYFILAKLGHLSNQQSVCQWSGRQGFNPIPKIPKMVLDATLPNTHHYKERNKGKREQSKEWSYTLPYISVQQLLKRELSGIPRLRSPTLLTYYNQSVPVFLFFFL